MEKSIKTLTCACPKCVAWQMSRGADGLWIADDMAGHCHGVSYTTDWYAAKQLALGLGMDPR